ncbi:hypothetical protein B0H15DRAFT_824785 [Mycena belliarum]|uniref:Uncharacterized protein n=1 Tax=Mycena belliarum TaxID=1033014 RepID=A0AAD6UD53_9AGAR|nr:hypothetical protein B0H15DRAFT_824785 [Mycena belliae]
MTSPQRTSASSASPSSRRTFSDRISAVGAKINRALSSEGRTSQNQHQSGYDPETESITSTIVEGGDRSGSRGRDTSVHSSGRGGAGNFHSLSNSNTGPTGEAQEFPWPRGRERAPVARAAPASATSRSTGRGGSGNFNQSPPATDPSHSLRDREILRAHAEAERNVVRSSGRGGMGNIVTPDTRSRSRSIDPISSPTSMRLGAPGYSPSPSADRQGAQTNGQVTGTGNVNGSGGGSFA